MADQVITKQELIDAQKDAQTLEDAVNGEPGKLIKSRTGREFYSLASVPQINTMTREEVTAAVAPKANDAEVYKKTETFTRAETNALVAPKANQADVDSAISGMNSTLNTSLANLSTTANKYYSTLAAANADIANIALNQSVTIGEEANSGLWEKKTAGATSLTKSSYDPLTQAKLYVSNTGSAAAFGLAQANINYVTATRSLVFSNTLFVVSGTSRYQLTTPQSVALPTDAPYRIEYVIGTGLIIAVEYNAARVEGNLVLGFVRAFADRIETLHFEYTVDGNIQYPSEVGELINTVATRINFDNALKKLVVMADNIRVKSPTFSGIISTVQNIAYPSSGIYKLVFSRITQNLSFSAVSAIPTPFNNIELATVIFDSNAVTSVVGVKVFVVDGLVTSFDAPSEYGELINIVPTRINFDTTAKTLTITNAVRIISASYTYVPPSNSVINFPATSGNYSLVFNKTSKTYSFKPQATVLNTSDVVLAYVSFTPTTFIPTVVGINSYAIDSLAKTKYSDLKTVSSGEIIPTSGFVNFDFNNNKVEIRGCRVDVGGVAYVAADQDVTIPNAPLVWHKLTYNNTSNTFAAKAITSGSPDGINDVVVGYFRQQFKEVLEVSIYQVDGVVANWIRQPLQNAGFRIPYGDVTSTYVGRVQPELNTLYTSIGIDLNAFYALYDDLAAQHPTYITKTDLGADKDGNRIYQYQFNAPEMPTESSAAKKPKIIIQSNIHGWEKAVTYVLYQSLKEICEQWQNSPSLEALRWGANLIVIPVVNPSGFIELGRKNSNGVDIERNFPSGWAAGSPSDDTYGGVSALSEPEAVIINNVLANNRDAIHFMSCHSFSATTTTQFPNGVWTWIPSATDFGVNLGKAAIMKGSIDSKKRYPFITSDYMGYADKGAPTGGSAYHATVYYGIQGVTFEINGRMHWEEGIPFLSSAVVTCGSDLLINWLLMNIKYATELYNSRVNI